MHLINKDELKKKERRIKRLGDEIQRKREEHRLLCFEYSELNELYRKSYKKQNANIIKPGQVEKIKN